MSSNPETLRVLITNRKVKQRSGTQLYVWDLSMGLLDRDHRPVVYSTQLGLLASQLQSRTIPVIDNLAMLTSPPDIIHGQDDYDTLTALMHFPGVPAVRFCHGRGKMAQHLFPRILRYVAVDVAVRDWLVCESGIPEQKVELLLNFADLNRFQLAGPLPARARRALVFCNNATNYLWAVQKACAKFDIQVDALGYSTGNCSESPEEIVSQYDLVFARGRCAIEALALGKAVILCGGEGVGPMVNSADFSRLRALNFGLRTFRKPLSPEALAGEIVRYDAQDAADVSHRLRATASKEVGIDRIVNLYYRVIEEHRLHRDYDPALEMRAIASYLRFIKPQLENGARLAIYLWLRSAYRRCRTWAGLRWIVQSQVFSHLRYCFKRVLRSSKT